MPPTSVSKWHGVVRNAVDVFAEGEEELHSNCDKDVMNHGGGVPERCHVVRNVCGFLLEKGGLTGRLRQE